MAFIFKATQIVGEIEEVRSSHARFDERAVILLEVSSEAKDQAQTLFDRIYSYLLSNPVSSLDRLSQILALYEANHYIKTLIITIFHENVLYLGLIGEGVVFLKRNDTVASLLTQKGTVSGFLQKHDQLFISSNGFISVIPIEKQRDLFAKHDVSQFSSVFTPLLSQKNHSGAIGMGIAVVEKEEVVPAFFSSPKSDELDGRVDEFHEEETVQEQDMREGVPFFQNLISKIPFKKIFHDSNEEIFETEQQKQSKRIIAVIASILLVLLITSIFLGLNTRSNKVKVETLNKTVEVVTHQIDEASSLIDLNPVRARSLLGEANTSLSGIMGEFAKGSTEYKTVQELLQKIDEQTQLASRIKKITTPGEFFDIGLLKKDGVGQNMALYNNNLVIFDTQNKAIYKLSIDNKQSAILAGESTLKDPIDVGIHGSFVYAVNTGGVISIDVGSKNTKVIIQKDSEWGTIKNIVAFAGNIYLLDTNKNQIWKYIAVTDGFSARNAYLNSDVTVDLSKSKAFSIDGSIYVTDGQNIKKFTQGQPDTFTFQEMVDNPIDIVSIFTNDDSKNLYLLDKGLGRIITTDKKGVYLGAYEWEGLKKASALVVSEEDKKALILSGNKIYSLPL